MMARITGMGCTAVNCRRTKIRIVTEHGLADEGCRGFALAGFKHHDLDTFLAQLR